MQRRLSPGDVATCHCSRAPLLLAILLMLAALCATPSSRADTLADIGFEFPGAFSKDTDPHSVADLARWTMADLGLDPTNGNSPPSAYAQTVDSTIGGARTNDRVFQFTLTPLSGYTISIASVSVDVAALRTASGATAQTVQIFGYTNLDAQATPVAAGFAIDSTTGDGPSPFTNFSTDLSGNSLYQNVGGQIVFSFYVFGSNASDYAYFDNIRVTGVTTAVPEPSTYALLGIAACALIGAAARRQIASARRQRLRS